MPEIDLCTQCGKEKRPRVSGSFTQWLLDQRYCDCGRIVRDAAVEPEIEYCPTCKKPKESGRPGSMTQWIFRASTCSCLSNPGMNSTLQSPSVLSDEPGAEQIDDPEELELDPRQFPVERYMALRELGRGGSGNVYLCRDRMLGIKVAVKTLRQLDNDQLIAFQTEARATSRLNHPTILRLLDFGPTESGSPYMVMEYFDGLSLHEWIETNGLPEIATTLSIFEKVASGLKKAHEQGIFHRDLKPTNILIRQSRPGVIEVKLIDFGIATIRQEEQPSTIVQGKTIVGTPAYMPPDTVRGGVYDGRSEIYSVGCVLYECLTGEPPFQADSALEVLRMHAEATPPPLNKPGGRAVPGDLERLVARCLEKKPEDRFASMDELASALLETSGHGNETANTSEVLNETQSIPQAGSVKKTKWMRPASLLIVSLASIAIIASVLYQSLIEKKRIEPEKRETNDLVSKNKSSERNIDKQVAGENDPEPDPAAMSESLARVATRLQNLEAAALKGDVAAQAELGSMYRDGEDVPQDNALAFKWTLKAAQGGDADSQASVGFMYKDGTGVSRDYKKALHWFLKAAAKNNQYALNAVAQIHHFGLGTPINNQEAARYYRKAVELGYSTAKNNLALLYERGEIGDRPDYPTALKLYMEAFNEGNDTAANNIGYMYMQGRGVRQNYSEAVKWFNIAAQRGCMLAHLNLAELYEKGLGVRQSYEEAIKHLKIASDNGDDVATNNLAHLYMSGHGGREHIADAMPLFRKAIEKNNYSAMSNLGVMYEDGVGCEANLDEAKKLYMVAARNGDLYANNNLGSLYKRGAGVPRDYKKAVEHYKFSADRGYDVAECNLAIMYLEGKGVKKSIVKAQSYFTSSADKGNAEASEYLGRMYATGGGVKPDYKKALKYSVVAARAGRPGAQYELARIFDEGLGHPKNAQVARYWYKRAADAGFDKAKQRLKELSNSNN